MAGDGSTWDVGAMWSDAAADLGPEPGPDADTFPPIDLTPSMEGDGARADSADTFTLDAAPSGASQEPTASRPAVETQAPAALEARYEDLGLLGEGGMGAVRRVRDRRLRRVLALKVLRPELMISSRARARFEAEAQLTSQLAHPAIVPVHDIGALADGRPYFTMDVVRGRTLRAVIHAVHAASRHGSWEATDDGWTFRRLVAALRTACEAVGHAHLRGVVHRDIKPANVMVDHAGRVLVMDWGLAKVVGQPDLSLDAFADELVDTTWNDGQHATRMGEVAGTPAYMAPEQAFGHIDALDARSDVYALGAMLYELLRGHAPYRGPAAAVLEAVRAGQPDPLALPPGPLPVPPPLWEACVAALARDPAERPADGRALASALADWLDGVARRERALALVDEAEAFRERAVRVEAEGRRHQRAADAALGGLRSWASVDEMREGWRLQDQAADCFARADLERTRMLQALQGALVHDPELPEAHARLAEWYRARHGEAEARGDRGAALSMEALLRAHDRGEHAAWLQGDGQLTLHTDPPGAEARLYRYVERDRRFLPEPAGVLGTTPLDRTPLPMGSWLIELHHPDRAVVRYPVQVARAAWWDGRPPAADVPLAIPLPAAGTLGPDDCYVPAGPARIGGDPEAQRALPASRPWIDGFVIQRFPVTLAEYIVFLDDLVASGRRDEALEHCPRERGDDPAAPSGLALGDDGCFHRVPDPDGDLWDLRWPAFLVGRAQAEAYAAWHAARTGLPWRLPTELEWEKASRGVDGRFYPWGDTFHAPWCRNQVSGPDAIGPARVDQHPEDESVYGVRGMAGNAWDWTSERAEAPDGTPRGIARGGCWNGKESSTRCAFRVYDLPGIRYYGLSFRLARSV